MVAPRKFTDEQRQQICDAYAARELLKVIAARFDTVPSTISTIAKNAGVQRRHADSKRARIIAAFKENPHGPVSQMANHCGMSHRDARQILLEAGFHVESVVDLGRAARDAGLTIAMIRALAQPEGREQ